MGEEWRDIPGYEGLYQTSDQGQIRNIQGRFLRPLRHDKGYLCVCLYKEGPKRRFIHTLVAETFLGKRPDGFQVDHIDGDRKNNLLSNLEYVTARENVRRSRIRHPLLRAGEENAQAKLTYEEVARIRSLLDDKELTQTEIAKIFGVSKSAIGKIKTQRTWKYGQGFNQGDSDLLSGGSGAEVPEAGPEPEPVGDFGD